jgi:hypothetical protein
MHPLTCSTAATRRSLSLSTALVLALSAGAGLAAEAPNDKTSALARERDQATVHHWGWANPHIAVMVERSSRALVDVLERADQALTVQEPVLAANNLVYADKLARAIELQMPYVEIKDRLETAKGKLEDGATHDFFDDLAPVYASIDDLLVVAPELSGQVKGKVRNAEKLVKEGKQGEALKQVDEVVDHVIATRVYIPILYVQGQIDAARKALTRDEIKAARKAVEKALGSLKVVIAGDTAEGTVDIASPDRKH